MKKSIISILLVIASTNSYGYYMQKLGRWLSRDPIGEKGGIQLYSHTLNDPINSVDILGLQKEGIGPDLSPLRPCTCCCASDIKFQFAYDSDYNTFEWYDNPNNAEKIKDTWGQRYSITLTMSYKAGTGGGECQLSWHETTQWSDFMGPPYREPQIGYGNKSNANKVWRKYLGDIHLPNETYSTDPVEDWPGASPMGRGGATRTLKVEIELKNSCKEGCPFKTGLKMEFVQTINFDGGGRPTDKYDDAGVKVRSGIVPVPVVPLGF